jgi:hypothetical protein
LPLLRREEPVLPDDVRRLGRRLYFYLLPDEVLVFHEVLLLNDAVVHERPVVALFGFEGGEDGAWPLQPIEQHLVILNLGVNREVHFRQLLPVFVFDVGAPGSEPVDHSSIVEGKGNQRYADPLVVAFFAIEAKVGHLGQPLLEFVLDE